MCVMVIFHHITNQNMSNATANEEEIVIAKAASWWLVKQPESPEVNAAIRERLGAFDKNKNLRFVLVTDCGHWGRGKTIEEAAYETMKAGASRRSKAQLRVFLNDEDPGVTSYGYFTGSSDSMSVHVGWIGTLGAIINAQPQ